MTSSHYASGETGVCARVCVCVRVMCTDSYTHTHVFMKL